MSASISHIPPEIVKVICKLLPVSALKTSRFISGMWNEEAPCCLYETVVLRLNHHSYSNLQNIARHARFYAYVRYIIYDLRTVPRKEANEDVFDWYRRTAGSGLGFPQRTIRDLLDKLSRDQINDCYSEYCQYLYNQSVLMDFDREIQMLDTIFVNLGLPSLVGLEYSYRRNTVDNSFEVPELASLSQMGRKMLVEADTCIGHTAAERRFWIWSLLIARRLIGSKSTGEFDCKVDSDTVLPIKQLTLVNFKLGRWQSYAVEPYSVQQYEQVLQLLEGLSVTMEGSDHEDYTSLNYLIEQTQELKSLSLTSTSYWDICTIIREKHLDRLATLSLDSFAISDNALFRQLLQRHRLSLRSLSLANINFEPPDAPEAQVLCNSDFWIGFVAFLHDHMKLTRVSFAGWFSNSSRESWVVASCGSEDCLKNRVERYAAAASRPEAPFPFRPRVIAKEKAEARLTVDNAGLYLGSSSTIDDDESWRYVKLA